MPDEFADWSYDATCRCPFADFDDPSKCCRTDMTRERAIEYFTATFGHAPEEQDFPERLKIGRQR
jgi:hypothetical protein